MAIATKSSTTSNNDDVHREFLLTTLDMAVQSTLDQRDFILREREMIEYQRQQSENMPSRPLGSDETTRVDLSGRGSTWFKDGPLLSTSGRVPLMCRRG
jgi:hypothetical protein